VWIGTTKCSLDEISVRGLGPDNISWAFSTFHMGHYQPFTWLTLGLDATVARAMYGNELDPRPYHFTNNLLHAINAALVFLLAQRLLNLSVVGRQSAIAVLLGSIAAALFFSIHPLRVESVAWATERRDLLRLLPAVGNSPICGRRLRNKPFKWLTISLCYSSCHVEQSHQSRCRSFCFCSIGSRCAASIPRR
jgi:hypothetical protein